ncbi:hypothetical protein [Evansella tamaricis]|uniref:Uncharacterized protein n=1 Tax=Evansella tamaricis TaxID=2069301 RepID=A0ABS6JDX2_9BACI|nr:hypothetical protein [Evansella tamaricis]MBU9711052.1 hypothetical protein [Evansella tamaricis]
MDYKFSKIATELVDEYMATIKDVKDEKTYQLYETMIKLNAEMTAKALEKYDAIQKEQQ